jgi:hemerythrin-like domain-containing protein
MAPGDRALAESYVLQLRVLLDTHFAKEEDGLFPLAERILDSEGLNNLGAEMERRKMEVRDAIKDL